MAHVEIGINEQDISGTMASPSTQNKSSFNFQMPQVLSVRAWLTQCFQTLRPWSTFINTSNFSAPTGVPHMVRRLVKNAAFFLSNYVVIFFILTLYCLLTTPLLLLSVCASLAACYSLSRRHSQRPLVVFGHTLTLEQQYGVVAGCSIPVCILAGAGSAMFWVFGASFFFSSLHAAFFNTAVITSNQEEDEFDGIMEDV